VPKIRITRTIVVTKEIEFDKSDYMGATDYRGEDYPEIVTAYDAVRWLRQEETDEDVALEHAMDMAADAPAADFYLKSTFEVLDDNEGEGA
jgi:hypothetical protein